MTNWRSRSLLLACALGLGLAGCGDDDNTPNDAGGDGHVHDAGVDSGSDAGDGDVEPPDGPNIRILSMPFGFPPGQTFHICVTGQGSSTPVMATITSTAGPNPELVEAPLPVGAVTQHFFEAAQLAQACGFPATSSCTANVYRSEDVDLNVLPIGPTPTCVIDAEAEILTTTTITPSTFTGADAFTVAFIGDAASLEETGPTPLSINIFPDEIVPTDATRARVRIVNFDPSIQVTAWEVCIDRNLGAGQQTLLGDTASVAVGGNPSASRSAYVNVDALTPAQVPDADGGAPTTVPIVFTVHPPDPLGLTHCNAIPLGPDGITATVWPADDTPFADVYAGYAAGVASNGAIPTQSFAAGQVVTLYLFRSPTGMEPPADQTVIAIPLLDSPAAP